MYKCVRGHAMCIRLHARSCVCRQACLSAHKRAHTSKHANTYAQKITAVMVPGPRSTTYGRSRRDAAAPPSKQIKIRPVFIPHCMEGSESGVIKGRRGRERSHQPESHLKAELEGPTQGCSRGPRGAPPDIQDECIESHNTTTHAARRFRILRKGSGGYASVSCSFWSCFR